MWSICPFTISVISPTQNVVFVNILCTHICVHAYMRVFMCMRVCQLLMLMFVCFSHFHSVRFARVCFFFVSWHCCLEFPMLFLSTFSIYYLCLSGCVRISHFFSLFLSNLQNIAHTRCFLFLFKSAVRSVKFEIF